jgi:uncharacterized protein YdiU (UPF0061 family)
LIENFLSLLQKHQADYTNSFRSLCDENFDAPACFQESDFKEWVAIWKKRLTQNDESVDKAQALMKKTNPVLIPRNHLVENALREAEAGEMNSFFTLWKTLKTPFNEMTPDEFTKPPRTPSPDYQTFCGT